MSLKKSHRAYWVNMAFNPIKNFSPIALHARVDWGVAVNAKSPVNSLWELADAV